MNRGIVIESWPHCFGCILAPRTAIDIVNLWLAGRQASGKVEHSYHGALYRDAFARPFVFVFPFMSPSRVVRKSLK